MTYTKKCPPPGVYRGIPDDEYHSWRALNASLIKEKETEAEWKYLFDNPKESTGAMRFGTLLHTAILQPSVFAEMNIVEMEGYKSPSTNRVRKLTETSPASYFTEADEECGGFSSVVGWGERLELAQSVVWSNERAAQLFETVPDDARELSIVWEHPGTGVLCKARIDALGHGPDPDNEREKAWHLIDLKTTRGLGRDFSNDAAKLGYHIAMAHYADAVHFGMGIPRDKIRGVFLAVQKAPIFDCQVLWLDQAFMDVGRVQLTPRVFRYANALLNNRWPGWATGMMAETTLYAPYWLMGQFNGGEI